MTCTWWELRAWRLDFFDDSRANQPVRCSREWTNGSMINGSRSSKIDDRSRSPCLARYRKRRPVASWTCRAPSTSPARASSAISAASRATTSPRTPLGPSWSRPSGFRSLAAPPPLRGSPCFVADPAPYPPPVSPSTTSSFEIDVSPAFCGIVCALGARGKVVIGKRYVLFGAEGAEPRVPVRGNRRGGRTPWTSAAEVGYPEEFGSMRRPARTRGCSAIVDGDAFSGLS